MPVGKSLIAVEATWRDVEQHFKFNVCYRTKGGFLRACHSKKVYLENAVDVKLGMVINNSNLAIYRSMK